jgi:hypothetical protein
MGIHLLDVLVRSAANYLAFALHVESLLHAGRLD